jgi:hypothetical protein
MHHFLQKNQQIFDLYSKYLKKTLENYPNSYLFSFYEIYNNVKNNLKNEDVENEESLHNAIYSVLEAMIYTSSNKVEDMVKRAEEDKIKRFHNMTKEQQKVVEKWSLNYE